MHIQIDLDSSLVDFSDLNASPDGEPGRLDKRCKKHGQYVHQAVPHYQPGKFQVFSHMNSHVYDILNCDVMEI